MPFKSKAQRRKFAQLLVEGKITPEVYEEWNRETGGATLPERVKKKPAARKKKKSVRSRRSSTAGRSRTGTNRRPKRKAARKR